MTLPSGNGFAVFFDKLKNALFRAGDTAFKKWIAGPEALMDLIALAIASILAVVLFIFSGGLDAIGNWERKNGLSYLHAEEIVTVLIVLGMAVAVFLFRRNRKRRKALLPGSTIPENQDLVNLFHRVETAKKEWERSLDSIEHMVILSDLDGTIIRCNRAFKDFIGRTYAEILRENFASLMTNFGIEVKDLDIRNLNARLYIMGKWFIVTSYPIEEFETGKVVKAVILMQDAATTKGSAKVQFIWGRAGYYRPDESQANRLPFPS